MGAGFSSLAAVDDRIYMDGDRDGAQQLLVLSAKDGSLIWKSRVGPVWNDEYGGPRSVDGGMVFALGTEVTWWRGDGLRHGALARSRRPTSAVG